MPILDTRSNMTSNNVTIFLLFVYHITNEKAVKLIKIDRVPAACKTYQAKTRSNNSCRYALLSPIYLGRTHLLISAPRCHSRPMSAYWYNIGHVLQRVLVQVSRTMNIKNTKSK